jgi:membrane fusion protein, adhesin transport system
MQKFENISKYQGKYTSFDKIEIVSAQKSFRNWLLVFAAIFLILLFMPWTQNIQTSGKVTTLYPSQRPQTIHSTIAGRIEKWYVNEGQLVKKGDTILHLTETKTDYFDPNLLTRTDEQVDAKSSAVESYKGKYASLEGQIEAMRSELKFKKEQLANKVLQEGQKLIALENELIATDIETQVADKQYLRTKELEQKGIKSLTDLEDKRVKLQSMQAKLVAAQNKISVAKNELENAKIQLSTVQNEYLGKIAKSESEKFSTLSDRFEAEGSVSKLKNQYENYVKRSSFYYITAPQDCYVTKAITAGLGETVKEGEPVVSILPSDYQLAVELFVEPIDLPLLSVGNEFRFIFDGWPAFIFSGWPNKSFGTYSGLIFAIDNNISENGKYRVLVQANSQTVNWPTALRAGGGAKGIALLNDVPVWYELWRSLNGFPPDFYKQFASKPKVKK